MRNIKFRVWAEEKKEMYIQGMNTTENNWIMECMFILDDFGIVPYVRGYNLENFEQVKDYELMQYTGFKDKNGKEIYEGDIIELINEDFEKIKIVCEFGTTRRDIYGNLVEIIGFYFKRLCDDRKTFPIVKNYLGKHDLELFEVVGNIYKNPELLKV